MNKPIDGDRSSNKEASGNKGADPKKGSAESLQFHYRIYGRVQGVGFRNWLTDLAHALGLKGFCRNRSDGTVELLAKAPSEGMLRTLEKELHKGPPAARVDRVEKDFYTGDVPEDFQVLATK